jgi:1,4-dihydroxy-2-naphthoate octaprenyltransferase
LITSGALLGVAAHFANVLKDFDQDLSSGIKGLPQRIGKRGSRVICSILLISTTVLLHLTVINYPLLIIGLIAAMITCVAPGKVIFKSLIITVIIDLLLLLSAIGSKIGSFVL